MKIYDVSRLPSSIALGWDGENNWRPIAFDCAALLAGHPDAVVTLWLLPKGETQAFPVALERDGNTVTWTPLNEEMTAEHGQLQIVVQDGTDVGKSKVIDYTVRDSLVGGADHPAETPSWAVQVVADVTEQADRAEEAAESIGESIGEQLPGAIADYLEEHPVTVTETDPTVPAWAKNPQKPSYTAAEVGAMPDSYTPPVQSVNGKTGAVVLDASDVGALPDDTVIPAAVTEQTVSGWGFTKNTGTYSKPSGGIPASDLAADMPFFTLPEGGQSGQALLSDGSGGAYWGAAQSGGTGLSDDAKTALLACFRNVAWVGSDGQSYYDDLYDALYPPASLTRITALFNQGGHAVYNTDTLDSLKQYLTVTAHYANGTTQTVTNYTLSGTLTAGTSTITVSYGGKNTTFNVTVSANPYSNPSNWLIGKYIPYPYERKQYNSAIDSSSNYMTLQSPQMYSTGSFITVSCAQNYLLYTLLCNTSGVIKIGKPQSATERSVSYFVPYENNIGVVVKTPSNASDSDVSAANVSAVVEPTTDVTPSNLTWNLNTAIYTNRTNEPFADIQATVDSRMLLESLITLESGKSYGVFCVPNYSFYLIMIDSNGVYKATVGAANYSHGNYIEFVNTTPYAKMSIAVKTPSTATQTDVNAIGLKVFCKG